MKMIDPSAVLVAAGQIVLAMTLVILLAGVVSLFLRRHPAAREGLWRAALLGVLVAPVVPWLDDVLALDLVTFQLPGKATAQGNDVPVAATATALNEESEAVTREPAKRVLPRPSESAIEPPPVLEPPAPAPMETAAAVESVPPISTGDASVRATTSTWGSGYLIGLLAGVWILGSLWHACRLGVGWIRCRRILASARALDATRYVAELRAAGNTIGAMPPVLVSQNAYGPGVIGVLRPRIVLPASLLEWVGSAELIQVLIHEAAHITRRDAMTNLLQAIAKCLFWPHPLIHWLNHRLREAREEVCDNFVLAHSRASSYSETLLRVAERCQNPALSTAGLSMVPRRGSLEERVGDLLDPKRNQATDFAWSRRLMVQAGLLGVLAVVGLVRIETGSVRADEPATAAVTKSSNDADQQTTSNAKAKSNSATQNSNTKITGRVLMPDGSPAEGATVILLGPPNNDGGYVWPLPFKKLTTDKEGDYSFGITTHGRYELWANREGLTSRKGRTDGKIIRITKLKEAPEPVELKLHEAVSVRVLVKDAATGKPIPNATVDLGWSDLTHSFTTDESGVAVVEPLTAERWQFQAFADGHAKEWRWLNLQGGEDAQTTFLLEPGATISGTVRNESGEPIPDAGVSARVAGAPAMQYQYVHADERGRYRIANVPLRQVEVSSSPEGYEPAEIMIDRLAGDRVVDITLSPRDYAGSIQGIVVDEVGKPIAGAKLVNYGRSSADVRKTQTDDNGRFLLESLYTGVNGPTVIVRAKGFAPKSVRVEPGPADDPAEVKITLEDGHHVRGRVVDEQGKPIKGVRVYEIPTYGVLANGQQATTDKQGRFRFDSLPLKSPFTFMKQGYSKIQNRKLPLDGEEAVTVVMKSEGLIQGRVTDAKTGKPINTFNVRITFSPLRRPDEPSTGLMSRLVDPGQTFQSKNGTFKLDGLTAGMPLQVTVNAEGYERGIKERVVARTASEVEPAEFTLMPLDPSKLTTYVGRLLGPDGKPAAGAQVRLIAAKNRRPDDRFRSSFGWRSIVTGLGPSANVLRFEKAATNAKGRFTFENIPQSAQVELAWWGQAVPPGRRGQLEKLNEKERTSIELQATKPARIIVTIDSDAFPNAASITFFRRRNDLYGYEIQRLKEGKSTYKFVNLPEGTYAIHLKGASEPVPGVPNGVTSETIARAEATVTAGQTARVPLDGSAAVEVPSGAPRAAEKKISD